MAYQFIKKLLSIFNQKEDILGSMWKLVEPIADIVEDPAKAYENKYEKMVLKHSPFHEDTGFLPLVEKIIELNYELLGYKDALAGGGYTNFEPGEILWLFRQFRESEAGSYRIELHYVPGKGERSTLPHFLKENKNGLFCWNPKNEHGAGSYFNKVLSDNRSIVEDGSLVA